MNITQPVHSPNRYERLIELIIKRRKQMELTQTEVSKKLNAKQPWYSKIEKQELTIDLDVLYELCEVLQYPLYSLLTEAGYIEIEDNVTQSNEYIVPTPDKSKDIPNGLKLALKQGADYYFVEINNANLESYKKLDDEISNLFERAATDKKFKNRDAISNALEAAISTFPNSNPSDLYQHIVYRSYLRDYSATDPKQSWVRAGGEAVELLIKTVYQEQLEKEGIIIKLAFDKGVNRNQFLTDMNLHNVVAGGSKLDIGLYGLIDNKEVIFGGIHSKASLAERVSDDVPCSEAMMKAGFFSYLFTFDSKSFPPPHGNLLNKGELGTIESPSDKRTYIEEKGQFSACFSFNFRTVPSGDKTLSGKKIITASSMSAEDEMITSIIRDWKIFKAKHKG